MSKKLATSLTNFTIQKIVPKREILSAAKNAADAYTTRTKYRAYSVQNNVMIREKAVKLTATDFK
jgi:hypothetical protein